MPDVRHLALVSGALGVALLGCKPASLSNTPLPSTTPAAASPALNLQDSLKQAAGFSADLKQAAGFGYVTNGAVSQLQGSAGLKQAAGFRVQSAAYPTFDSQGHYAGLIGNADGTLVASGSIDATNPSVVGGVTIYSQFTLNLTVATASTVPSLLGAALKGTLVASANTNPPGLTGTLHVIQGTDDRAVDFGFNVLPTATTPTTQWVVTVPVTTDASQSLWAHLLVNQDHSGNGWVSKDHDGTSAGKVAGCDMVQGQWEAYPLDNQAATASIDMPFNH